MKKFLVMLMLVASTLSMVSVDADAKRLGGGGSFGRARLDRSLLIRLLGSGFCCCHIFR